VDPRDGLSEKTYKAVSKAKLKLCLRFSSVSAFSWTADQSNSSGKNEWTNPQKALPSAHDEE